MSQESQPDAMQADEAKPVWGNSPIEMVLFVEGLYKRIAELERIIQKWELESCSWENKDAEQQAKIDKLTEKLEFSRKINGEMLGKIMDLQNEQR